MTTDLEGVLAGPAELVAPRLLGCELVSHIDNLEVVVRIVETEAYDATDAASHSYHGQTARNSVMFGPAGFLYVYFTYGRHYCANIVTGRLGQGSAVLLRAVEPVTGSKVMSARRHFHSVNVTNGPAKLCQALAIDKQFNGHNLTQSPVQLLMLPALDASQIVQTTRIGISRAQTKPWRFYIKNNLYVSKL